MTAPNRLAILGGTVVSDKIPPYRGEVIISGDRITDIVKPGSETGAETTIDGAGCFVLPGFIDAHVHGESLVFDGELSEIPLRQGVTTYILGQDGCSSAPGTTRSLEYMSRYFAPINGEQDTRPQSVEQLLDKVDQSAYLNVAFLVPHGNIRLDAMGLQDRAPEPPELRAMVAAVERGLESGAVGVSTGLDYIPSRYAAAKEFNALAAPVNAAGRVWVSHMRGYGQQLRTGMTELAGIAAATGVKIHASHLWGTQAEVIEALARCDAIGAEPTFDAYPYRQGCSLLRMAAVSPALQAGGMDATISRLKSPDGARRLNDELDPELPSRLTLSYVEAPGDRELTGLTVDEAAASRGQSPAELICDLLVRSDLSVGVLMARANFTDEDRDFVSRHNLHMGSSDGIFAGGRPHPRGWAAFTKLADLYLRTDPVDGWAAVAAHLSSRAADRFGLRDRGRIQPGLAADIVVLDPDFRVRATYQDPRQLSSGTRHVLVNGTPVIREGAFVPSPRGKAIRSG